MEATSGTHPTTRRSASTDFTFLIERRIQVSAPRAVVVVCLKVVPAVEEVKYLYQSVQFQLASSLCPREGVLCDVRVCNDFHFTALSNEWLDITYALACESGTLLSGTIPLLDAEGVIEPRSHDTVPLKFRGMQVGRGSSEAD
jgi:hypothetical protein